MVPRALELHPSTRKRLLRLTKEAERDGSYRVAKRLQAVVLNAEGHMIGHVLQAIADRNEVGFLWIAGPAFGVHRVEQAVLRKFGMKDESDETAFEPVVHAIGKSFRDVGVYLGPVVLINEVQKATGIVGQAAAVGKFSHVADPRPSSRRHVLIGRTCRRLDGRGSATC